MASKRSIAIALCAPLLGGCAAAAVESNPEGIRPAYSFPVTDNATPYSQCLESLRPIEVSNLPTFAVGEVPDKTGQFDTDDSGRAVTQGAAEMVMSALAKTGKANLVERLDLRIPLAEVELAEQGRLDRSPAAYGRIPASDFIVTGAITELNYNIVSGGARLFISGVGAGVRTVVINVGMDLRVIDSTDFSVPYVTSLQKQIYGFEVEGDIFRFFGTTLVEFNAGQIKNEPLQLGVRSVSEMAVYQVMTDFLGLPQTDECRLVETGHMEPYLDAIKPQNDSTEEEDDA